MSRIYEILFKLKTDRRQGVFTVITTNGNRAHITFQHGKISAGIWQTKDDRSIPLWFYLQTNSDLVNDAEFRELEETAKERGISPGELLSNAGNLNNEKRTKYIKGKLEEILFNVFSMKDDEIVGTTFSEKEILYPNAEMKINLDVTDLWNLYIKKIKDLELVVDFFGDKNSLVRVITFPEEGLKREERFICNFIGSKKYLAEILTLPIPNKLRVYQILAELNSKKVIDISKEKIKDVSDIKTFSLLKTFAVFILIFAIGILLPVIGHIIRKTTHEDIQYSSRTKLMENIKEKIRSEILIKGTSSEIGDNFDDNITIKIGSDNFSVEIQ